MQCRPNPDERTDLIHFILFFLTFDILDNNIAESVCVECSYIAAKHLLGIGLHFFCRQLWGTLLLASFDVTIALEIDLTYSYHR